MMGLGFIAENFKITVYHREGTFCVFYCGERCFSLFCHQIDVDRTFLTPYSQISLVIAAVIGVIVYRLAIRGIIAKTSLSDDIAVSSIIVSGAGAMANFIFILFMSTVYYKLAHFLTDWGM